MEYKLSDSYLMLLSLIGAAIIVFVVSGAAYYFLCRWQKCPNKAKPVVVMTCACCCSCLILGIALVAIRFFWPDDFAAQTKRIASIYATSTDGQNIHLVCGEDGVQDIKILGMDTEAGTARCEYKENGLCQTMDISISSEDYMIVSSERWGHKDGVWGLRGEADMFVSLASNEGSDPLLNVWVIEKGLDTPELTKTTNYTFALDSGYTVNWDDPEAPTSLK